MNQVTVKRTELLEKLILNRSAHRDQFLKAQQGYRESVIKELDQILAEARAGKRIRRGISLPEPQDRTEDYDCAILMLEMSVDETLTITAHEFAQFVQDRWSWSDQVTACNMSYIRNP